MPTPEEIQAQKDAEAKAAADKAAAEEAAARKKGKENDPVKMQAKLDEQLAEIKKLKERNASLSALEEKAKKADELEGKWKRATELANHLGVDLTKETEETLKAKREADARAAEEATKKAAEKTAKIQDAVIDALFERGMKLDKRDRGMILRQALDELKVDDEEGDVTGLAEFVDWAAARFGGDTGDGKKGSGSPRAPQQRGGSGAALEEKFKTVDTFRKLVDMGESARAEYQKKYPERYELLQTAHRSRARVTVAPAAGAAR